VFLCCRSPVDDNGLGVEVGTDPDQVAGLRRVDGGLDRRDVGVAALDAVAVDDKRRRPCRGTVRGGEYCVERPRVLGEQVRLSPAVSHLLCR
jgi:hypothetical protein